MHLDHESDTLTPSSTTSIMKIPLFQRFGIELEYMIVDKTTLNILPITDKLFYAVTGAYEDEVIRGEISWSNELSLHVIELKTSDPVESLDNLHTYFQTQVNEINELLKPFNGMLMPTAMHPWMDPFKETKLWPHSNNPIYESYHRIFDCRGHGWSNLQSTHINLPFANDEEFSKLHASIRALLPIMPAMAASSPIVEEKFSNYLDTRLNVYQNNSKSIPSITGKVIPETAVSQSDYRKNILQPMYRDIAPLDTGKLLQHEWLNSRGAIARFDRFTIEIRVLDIQECPIADLAIAHAIVSVLKALTENKWTSLEKLNALDINYLQDLFLKSVKDGEMALIENGSYLEIFGLKDQKNVTVGDLWKHLIKEALNADETKPYQKALDVIMKQGPLARRIQKAWKSDQTNANLRQIYKKLCECLQDGKMFE